MELDKDILREGGLEAYGLFYSKYVGIVYDRNDPDKKGRLKLKVPQLWDDQVHDYWAEPSGMISSAGVAIFGIPRKGEQVWVSFQMGNQRFPIWEHNISVGGMPDGYNSSGQPNILVIRAHNGSKILISGDDNSISLLPVTGGIIKLNGDAFEGIAKILTLQSKYNNLEADLNNLKTLIASWVIAPGDGGLALKTLLATWVTQMLALTTSAEIQNNKVKHG